MEAAFGEAKLRGSAEFLINCPPTDTRQGAAACDVLQDRKSDTIGVKVQETLRSRRAVLAGLTAATLSASATVAMGLQTQPPDSGMDLVSVRDHGARGDGATDDTEALQAAFDSGAARVYLPAGIYRVRKTLKVPDNLVVEGSSRTRAQILLAKDAAEGTDVMRVGQHVSLRDLWIRGNWDGKTTRRAGTGIRAEDSATGHIHGLTLENVQVDRCKQHGIHIIDGAYCRMWNVDCNTHGGDALYLEGTQTASATTTEIGGSSIFSSCNGYGVHLRNCASMNLTFISEYSMGVGIEGENRALSFKGCYFETPRVQSLGHVFNCANGGIVGLTIQDCYLGMATADTVISSNPNILNIVLINNINLSGKRMFGALLDKNVQGR